MTISIKRISISLIALFGLIAASAAHAKDQANRSFKHLKFQERGNSGVAMAPLWAQPKKGIFTMFVRIKAGKTAPFHTQTHSYHGVVLKGNWVHYYGKDKKNAHVMKPGDHAFQAGKEVHTDGCAGPEDCVFLVTIMGPPDNIPYNGN